MDRLAEFRIFYNHTIHPELIRMENKRRRLILLFCVSVFILLGTMFWAMYVNVPTVTLFLLLPLGFYIAYLVQRIRDFIYTFKPNIVNLILDFIDDDLNFGTLRYEPQKFIPKKTFQASQIFASNAAFYKGEDYISGMIGELPFEMCELKVRELSKVRDRYNYVFKGIFLKATIKRPILGSILILPRAFKQYLFRSIKNFNLAGGQELDNEIVVQEFYETFNAYATDDAQTHLVLSGEIQERIATYQEKLGREIYLSLIGNDIYIAITEPKDILEPSVLSSNVSFKFIKNFFEDIQLLLTIVQDFDNTYD